MHIGMRIPVQACSVGMVIYATSPRHTSSSPVVYILGKNLGTCWSLLVVCILIPLSCLVVYTEKKALTSRSLLAYTVYGLRRRSLLWRNQIFSRRRSRWWLSRDLRRRGRTRRRVMMWLRVKMFMSVSVGGLGLLFSLPVGRKSFFRCQVCGKVTNTM